MTSHLFLENLKYSKILSFFSFWLFRWLYKYINQGNENETRSKEALIPIFKSYGIFLDFVAKSYQINYIQDQTYHLKPFQEMAACIENYLDQESDEVKKGQPWLDHFDRIWEQGVRDI